MSDDARVEAAAEDDAPTRERLSRPVPVARSGRHSRFWRWRRALARRTGIALGAFAINLMSKTWRARWEGRENLEAARGAGGGHFITLWHGSMLVPMAHHKGCGWLVLVSPSRDGDTIAPTLKRFGYGVIRGSATRGGARALREMLDALRGGSVLIITPDGPRGPMHAMNPGLVWMARATGYKVVPSGFVADRAWHLKSWDQFTIPKPFARLAFVFGPPIRVAREATTADLEAASLAIAEAMRACERQACEMLGMEPDG
jgi:lysophospholipid acyltransferase (LPLAT)-like uncharacterized protein